MIPHSKPALGIEEKNACAAVLDSLHIAQGEKVEEFERAFCGFTGRRYGVAVSSGTAGLILSLHALGISKADEVIVPSYTCVALLHAVHGVGAVPVVADIDIEDFNISAGEIKKKITRKTKAVIVPHAFGRGARIREIVKLGIPVIEDGTQALGAAVEGKPAGGFGVMSVFSFYATKMITTGEGGMILTDSGRFAGRLADMRDYDKKGFYDFRTNSKMTDLEAAIGIEQLKKLPRFIQRRREIAARYQEAFGNGRFVLPAGGGGREHVYYRYVIRVPARADALIKSLNVLGVDVKRPVFMPMHQYLGKPGKAFPASVQAMREACSLPIYPALGNDEIEKVVAAVKYVTNPRQKEKKTASIPH